MSSMTRFLSTPSARRATRRYIRRRACCRDFYPRPPRGGRLEAVTASVASFLFLSTPSARRATRWLCIRAMPSLDFYPRPPRGGRLHCWDNVQAANEFLSTPSARRATLPKNNGGKNHEFLSTPSARRATEEPRPVGRPVAISIHALREEGDKRTWGTLWC